MVHLNDDERNLLLVQGLLTFGDSLASIFVTIFIFAHSDFRTVLLFNLISYATLLPFLVLSGSTLRKVSSGSLIRLSLVGSALFYFSLFLLRGEAIHFLAPLAILDGAAAGTFWSAFNLNQYIFTKQNTRVRYFGSGQALASIFGAAGPIIGGTIISFLGMNQFLGLSVGYTTLFLLVSVVFFATALFVGHLPEHEVIGFSYRDFLTHKRSTRWKMILAQHAIVGLFDVLVPVVFSVLVYLIVKQEFFVGGIQTTRAILTSAGAVLAIHALERAPRAYWIGVLGVASGIAIFAFRQTLFGLFFATVALGLTWPFLNTWLGTVYFSVLDSHSLHWKNKYHMMLERDVVLGVPRIISYLVLYFVMQSGNQVKLAQETLFFLPILPIILGVLFTIQRRQVTHITPAVLPEAENPA